ncbi:SDR family oxidoreductase [Leptolyngbya ohadii]|uniref:SDR family oxidoreductase n=1 Tax=Leptolyngbya ohadii TaxID=1962290 RepID=UPI000B599E58|nr:SDR family oxidoreductase [Leptolyngbya ohadii]
MTRVFITAATGNVGAETIRLLSQQLPPGTIVAGVRSSDQANPFPSGVEVFAFDFLNPQTFSFLQNVDKLLLVRPPQLSQPKRDMLPLLQVARSSGVRHVVFLSLLGVQFNPLAPHRKIEQYIRQLGFRYTFLRPSFFMQNLITTHRSDIRDRHQILLPAGQGRTSFIDVRDIAAVAAQVLAVDRSAEQNYLDRAFDLTGSEALTYAEVAAILSKVLETSITYRAASIREFSRHMAAQGYPKDFIRVMIGIYSVARFGLAGKITDDLRQLLGREPISFRQFAEDYQVEWQ